jgi:gliding motility-associated-like protein
MKNLILLIFIIISSSKVFGQGGTWTWIHGNTHTGAPVYGTQGVSNATNVPPGRYHAVYWTDLNGGFWMYSGGLMNSFNDLWKYNVYTNEWTWMKGPQNQNNLSAVYGVQGVSSPLNNPAANQLGGFGWVDNNNNLWMFQSTTNELWKYNIATNEWTFMKTGMGTTTYGTQGVGAPGNNPPSVMENKCAWVDYANNNLYMYEGNDMWMYNISTNNWTWLKGTQGVPSTGNYGTLGVASNSNIPPGRYIYSYWQDEANNLYMYGGFTNTGFATLSDIWKYDISNNMWTWVGGTQLTDYAGNYDGYCKPANNKYPRGRLENRSAYPRCSSFAYDLGGITSTGSAFLNDLWFYNISNNEWTWLSGSSATTEQIGDKGVKGIPAVTNMIPGKWGIHVWTDTLFNLYVFGGETQQTPLGSGILETNDMWRFVPDTSCMHKDLKPSVTLTPPTKLVICPGDSTTLDMNNQYTFTYAPNTGVFVNPADTTILQLKPTETTTYTIVANNKGNCYSISDSMQFTIVVHQWPVAQFSIQPASAAIDTLQGISMINLSSNNYTNSWYYNNTFMGNDTNFYFSPPDSGTYCFTLVTANQLGCSDTIEHCIYVTKIGMQISMPNAFTPNKDGNNDKFKPHLKNVKKMTMLLYNRWGEMIYKTSHLDDGWDGTIDGQKADMDTYFYVVKYMDVFGDYKVLKGDFELIR